MRVAVLVYGRLNRCVEHYDNIMFTLGGENNNIEFFASSDNSSESLLHDFIRLYKPIVYNNSPIQYDYNLNNYPGKRGETNIHNMTCHFINKNRVFMLLEDYVYKNNIHYDCVVSLRVDCLFQDKIDFTSLGDNTIYIPLGYDYINNAINDQVAYGKLDVMKHYNSINAEKLLKEGRSIPHPESLTYANIKFYNLNIERPNINYHLDK